MPTDFTPLHLDFETLAEQVTAPGRIDIDHAIATGRRAASRRRATRAGIAAMGVTATTALALTVVNLAGTPSPRQPSVSATRTATDPVASAASFGWLPTGMQINGYRLWSPEYLAPERTTGLLAVGDSNELELELGTAPAGPRPTIPLQMYKQAPVFTDGPSINGHQSVVESFPGHPTELGSDTHYWLMWQFDDGTWVTLSFDGPENPLSEADALHIAKTVTEKPYPIAQNFQIDGPLAQAGVVSAEFYSTRQVTLTMRAGSAEIDISIQGQETPGGICKVGPVPQSAVCVTVHGRLPASLAKDGTEGLLDDITLLKTPTTDVIRQH